MKNVFDLVMEREKMMESLYRNLLKDVQNLGIKRILSMLAEDESKHYDHFSMMKKTVSSKESSSLMVDSKEILTSIKTQKDIGNLNVDQIDLYEKIRNFEKESELFFVDLASKESDEKLKEIYNDFAEEEHRHYLIMDEICDFITKPNVWVENSEFSSISSY